MQRIAIDLGAAYSTAARLNDEGIPMLIPDAQQPELLRTESLVHLGASGPLVGLAAAIAASAQPDAPTIEDAKTMLASGRVLAFDQSKKSWRAEDCVGLLLAKLRQDASVYCFESIDEVLLTVPSRFTSAQRDSFRRAAEAAGMRVRALVDEALAAAVYATAQEAAEQTVLVLQGGRSCLEASVVRCTHGNAAVLVARHDSSLGGKAIDQRLADEIARAQGWTTESLSPAMAKQLLHFAEELKIELCQAEATASPESQVRRQSFVGNAAVEFVLTQWHFDGLIAPMIERAMELVERVLAEAGFDPTKIDRVVLVGGASQLPALRAELMRRFAWEADRIVTKDCTAAVAYGAAILAAQPDDRLAQIERSSSMSGEDADSISQRAEQGPTSEFEFGIRIGDPRTGQAAIYKLIKRGTALPATASKQFRTSRVDQPRLIIEAVKTDGSIRRAESLGHFALALPPGLPANHPVIVTMHCDAAGHIRIEAESSPVRAQP
ncbi:MAG: Hsp70 family protein [Aureliella sp.]